MTFLALVFILLPSMASATAADDSGGSIALLTVRIEGVGRAITVEPSIIRSFFLYWGLQHVFTPGAVTGNNRGALC